MLAIQRKAGRKISARKEVAQMDRLRRSYERKLEARLKRFFPKQFNQIASQFESTGRLPNIRTLDEKIAPILTAHYLEVITTFGQRVLDRLEIKFDFGDIHRRYLFGEGGSRIKGIDDYTELTVNRILFKASEQGLSNREIAKQIQEAGRGFSKRRAAVIARTETHTASSFAHHTMHKEFMSDKTVKQWVSTSDARTRSGHAAMNGNKVGIDEDFEVPTNGVSVKMQYAGDPKGGAANVVNCRCTIIYIDEADELLEPVSVQPAVSDRPWLELDGVKPTETFEDLTEIRIPPAPSYLRDIGIVRNNGVDLEELSAIHAYTGSFYREWNSTLRAWFKGETIVPSGNGYVNSGTEITDKVKADLLYANNKIKSGLKKMQKFKGEVTRGIDIPDDQVENFIRDMGIKEGGTYRTEAIFSTGKGNAGWSGNIRFSIQSKSGRYIDSISNHKGEKEVLFPAGHEFRILRYEFRDKGYRRELYIEMEDLQDDIKAERNLDWPKEPKNVSRYLKNKFNSEAELASIDNRLITLD